MIAFGHSQDTQGRRSHSLNALRLKLVPKAPDGMATMAITTAEVKYQAPALSSGYSRVVIGCGGTTLGDITEIMNVY